MYIIINNMTSQFIKKETLFMSLTLGANKAEENKNLITFSIIDEIFKK